MPLIADAVKLPRRPSVSPVNFLLAPGEFCTPPVAHAGYLWMLSTKGTLYRLSPLEQAKPIVWSRIPSSKVGLNCKVAVDVTGLSAEFQGPILLAPDPQGIYAVSLVRPDTHVLLEHRRAGTVITNISIEESPYFRSIAANTDFVCFLHKDHTDNESGASRLIVRYFQSDRPSEELTVLSGRSFIGPIVSGDSIALCTENEIHIVAGNRSQNSYPLPSNFAPYFQRPASLVNIPLGQPPLAFAQGPRGWEAWIGGELRQEPGVLKIELDRARHDFFPVPQGSCLCHATGAGLMVNRISDVDFYGIERPVGRFKGLQRGMPMALQSGAFIYFVQTEARGAHELAFCASGSEPCVLSFTDPQCTEDSCCGIHYIRNEVLVSYMHGQVQQSATRGLKFAHWSVT